MMQQVIVLAITIVTAIGHVSPSVDDNNRYVKLTPAADRVRLAYTVFFGEVPGGQLRRTLDSDGDRQISEEEAQAFGTKLAHQVADGLEVTIDGASHPVAWETVAVGMGSPAVTGQGAGAFSVDLVAWLCLPAARGRHTLLLRDRFRVERPGETELRVEDAYGVTIEHARVGALDAVEHDFKFLGPGGPLLDDGLDLAFVAGDKAPLGDRACRGGRGGDGDGRGAGAAGASGRAVVAGVVAISALALAGAGWLLASRRARRRRSRPR